MIRESELQSGQGVQSGLQAFAHRARDSGPPPALLSMGGRERFDNITWRLWPQPQAELLDSRRWNVRI
ncbi:hypothetical protein ACWEJ6_51270 [Nonomuraea sp. NPDC004702]